MKLIVLLAFGASVLSSPVPDGGCVGSFLQRIGARLAGEDPNNSCGHNHLTAHIPGMKGLMGGGSRSSSSKNNSSNRKHKHAAPAVVAKAPARKAAHAPAPVPAHSKNHSPPPPQMRYSQPRRTPKNYGPSPMPYGPPDGYSGSY